MRTLPDQACGKGPKQYLRKVIEFCLFFLQKQKDQTKVDEYYTEMIKGVIENYAY